MKLLGGFKTPDGKPVKIDSTSPGTNSVAPATSPFGTSVKFRNPKQEQLAIFKDAVLQMISENKSVKEVMAFTTSPSPETRYGKSSNSPLGLAFFGGILKYTTVEDRQAVLLEISE